MVAFAFTTVINMTKSRSLHVRLNAKNVVTLQVAAVTGGLFQQWNQGHPELAVQPGARLIEVISIRDNASLMAATCWEQQSHNLRRCG